MVSPLSSICTFGIPWVPCYYVLLSNVFLDGELAESMKESITRLIFKKRGDAKHLKNWRPISLLNVDYEIISKVTTIRLSKVIELINHSDQTCSVPGRNIFSVLRLRDILDHTELTRECAILVNLDQEKAFDRVDRSFCLLYTSPSPRDA